MPSSYAILGSTGNIGQAVLQVLLQSPDNIIHAYCRSEQKLWDLLPEDNRKNDNKKKQIKIYQGGLDDTRLLMDCVRGVGTVFLAVAPPGNQPGCTVVLDAARQVVAALEQLLLQQQQKAPQSSSDTTNRLPKIVLASSASTEHRLMSDVSRVLRDVLYRAFSNTYDDLKAAEAFLRSKQHLTSMTFVKPGALSNDAQKGHVLSLEAAKSPLSYLDLAAGMIEVADEDGDRYDGKSVAVNATAQDVAFPWEAPLKMFWGLLFHFFPWLYRLLG